MTRVVESVSLSLASGDRLAGTVDLAGPDSRSIVLYVHGFGSDRAGTKGQALHEACIRHGFGYAAFDFRGHGRSTGQMVDLRASSLLEDLESIRLHLAGRGVRKLFLAGSSMGGFASSWYALEHPQEVPAVVLMAPAFRFLHGRLLGVSEEERLRWQQEGRFRVRNQWIDVELSWDLLNERDRFDPEELARRWRTPALIFHGMNDETVDWRDTVDLVEKVGTTDIELRLWRAGDHRLLEHRNEMALETCRFFAARWE